MTGAGRIARRAGARLRSGSLQAAALDREQTFELRPPYAGIHGWALAEAALDRVEVRVEGAEPARARLFAAPRPDLAERSPQPSAPIAGWEAAIDLAGIEPGTRVTVAATAVGGGGERSLGQTEMVVSTPRSAATTEHEWLETLRARALAEIAPRRPAGELRLLVFTHQLDLGGAQLYLQELLRRLLIEPDISCTVMAQSDGPLRAELEGWGATVHITGQEPRLGSIYESRMRELVLLANRFEPDIVLANTTVAFWGVDLAARLGIPSVWAIHESVPVNHYPHMVWPPFDQYVEGRFLAALRTADRVVFEAEATRDLYRDHVDERRIVHLNYGIDLAGLDAERAALDRDELRARHGFGEHERVILCMGTIEPRKAQASLALAFARLASEFPNSSLVLVGDREDDYSRAVHEMIARLPLAKGRVRALPVVTDTSSWYELADAFALPSDLESLPRTILEAMSFELPVLAARAFGVPELVADGSNGVLCEPRSLDSLTAGLRRLLAFNSSELAEVGRAGGRTVRPAHDSAGYAAAYRRLLDDLTGQIAEQTAEGQVAESAA